MKKRIFKQIMLSFWKFLMFFFKNPSELLRVLNNINPVIEFTLKTSDTISQLPFLFIVINKEGKKVFMNIYSKPTESKRYVSLKSNHPEALLKKHPIFSCS